MNGWHKSSHAADNGCCVEVSFHKSSASADNGACVEVGTCDCDEVSEVLVRDSKDPTGPWLSFAPAAFAEFLAGVKLGQFDRR